ATLLENRNELVGEEQVSAFEDAVIRRGYYPFRTDPAEVQHLSENEAEWHTLFQQKMLGTVEKWMELADERLAGTGIRCFCCPGPPYGTGLDDAPELTADMRLKDAGRAPKPCGSTAVRDVIKEHQPVLSLHGHIHEARGSTRIGNTLAINPGSSYEQGQLL